MAAVRASIPRKVVQEVARHTLRKGIWTKLLAPSRAFLRMHGLLDAEEETPEEGHRSHPLWEVSARGLEYHETWRRPIRRPKHINITELQAFVTKESRIANPFPASRILFGLDSQVSLGAVVKGSPALNRVLQHGICFAIGGDVPCTTTLPPTELTIRHVVQHQSRQTLTCPAGFPNLNGLRQLGHLRLEQNCLLKTFAEGKTWTFALQLR